MQHIPFSTQGCSRKQRPHCPVGSKWLSTQLGRGRAGAGGGLPDPAPPRVEREEYTFVSPVASPHKFKAGGGGGGQGAGGGSICGNSVANGVLVKCTLTCLRNQTHSQSGQDAAHGTAQPSKTSTAREAQRGDRQGLAAQPRPRRDGNCE